MKPSVNNIMKGCCLKKLKEEKTWIIRQSNDIYKEHLQKVLETNHHLEVTLGSILNSKKGTYLTVDLFLPCFYWYYSLV